MYNYYSVLQVHCGESLSPVIGNRGKFVSILKNKTMKCKNRLENDNGDA